MVGIISLAIVLLTATYLVVLGTLCLVRPSYARRFLLGFASSARAHYAELVLRLIVGVALILYAPRMLYTTAFTIFGWVIVATTVTLLFVPWVWHHRFAQRVVPPALRYIALIGLLSLALGGGILMAVLRGGGA